MKEVKLGAKLLDEKYPNWYIEIKLKKLSMSDIDNCILGQLFGSYFFGIKVLGIDAEKSGFTIINANPITKSEWKPLNKAWKKQIKKRRKNGVKCND